MAIDIERVVAAAADSYLGGERGTDDRGGRGRGRLRGAGALALGVGIGLAAQAAYRRAREVDLETAASALEQRLKG